MSTPEYRESKLNERIAELERRNAMLSAELNNIANAKRFDKECFDDDRSFADWAQSRARHTLSATSADTEAWIQDELVKRLGEPVGYLAHGNLYKKDGSFTQAVGEVVLGWTPVYRLPSPLATPEERKD